MRNLKFKYSIFLERERITVLDAGYIVGLRHPPHKVKLDANSYSTFMVSSPFIFIFLWSASWHGCHLPLWQSKAALSHDSRFTTGLPSLVVNKRSYCICICIAHDLDNTYICTLLPLWIFWPLIRNPVHKERSARSVFDMTLYFCVRYFYRITLPRLHDTRLSISIDVHTYTTPSAHLPERHPIQNWSIYSEFYSIVTCCRIL